MFLGNKDPTPDKHCVFYSGLVTGIDRQVIVIEESDRQDAKAARAVFRTIAPEPNVRIANVYQLL